VELPFQSEMLRSVECRRQYALAEILDREAALPPTSTSYRRSHGDVALSTVRPGIFNAEVNGDVKGVEDADLAVPT